MAYSRWLTSRWYTFWADSPSEVKEEQVFQICEFGGSMNFTYTEISEDLDKCIDDVILFQRTKRKIQIKEELVEIGPFTVYDSDIEELRGYMREFIEHMDEEYGESTKEGI